MSYLIRTGTGRNNIEFGGGSEVAGNYLIRTNNGRNDIQYQYIDQDINIMTLERTGFNRNDIEWNILKFSFPKPEPEYSQYVREMFFTAYENDCVFFIRSNTGSSAYVYTMTYTTFGSQDTMDVGTNTGEYVRDNFGFTAYRTMYIAHMDSNVINNLYSIFNKYAQSIDYPIIIYATIEDNNSSAASSTRRYIRNVSTFQINSSYNVLEIKFSNSPTVDYGEMYINNKTEVYLDLLL